MKNWLLLCVIAVALSSCASRPIPPENIPRVGLPDPFEQQGVQVVVEGITTVGSGYYVTPKLAGIYGIATNASDRNIRMLIIRFDVVDGAGVKVSEAHAHTNGLQAGQQWRFKASFSPAFTAIAPAVTRGRVQVIFERDSGPIRKLRY